jgi:hypothetical protein
MQFSFHDKRLVELERELRPGDGPCPFVVLDPPSANIRLTHFSAGRDATYVMIDDARDMSANRNTASVTIGYAPFVEGPTLIYDLTDETLQGKARPVSCDLCRNGRRVYAVVPVQIETIRIRMRRQQIEIEFHDALGERIQAALPFQLTASGASRDRIERYACTTRDGRFAQDIPDSLGAAPWTIVVGSLLTGRAEHATLRR